MLRPDPIPDLKRQLAAELVRALKGWKPTEVWFRLHLDHARLWELRHARLERFSLQRLIRLLAEADKNVTITVTVRGRDRLTQASPLSKLSGVLPGSFGTGCRSESVPPSPMNRS